MGAGSVFLNTDFEQYLLADINPDLINLYNIIKEQPEQYIRDSKALFTPEYNPKRGVLGKSVKRLTARTIRIPDPCISCT